MENMSSATAVTGLFALRCLVPLVATLIIGYGMSCLCRRWQMQPDEHMQSFVLKAVPCWEIKGCDPAAKEKCAACREPNVPCWLAHLKAMGSMPASCQNCPVFAQVAAAR